MGAIFDARCSCVLPIVAGFALEKVAAMQEHGLKVYFTGTWVSCKLSCSVTRIS